MTLSDKFANIAARNAMKLMSGAGQLGNSTELGSQAATPTFIENLLTQMGLSPDKLKEQAEAIVKTLTDRLESIDNRLKTIEDQQRMIINGQQPIVPVPEIQLPVWGTENTIGCSKCGGLMQWCSDSITHNHYRCDKCGFDDSVEKR